jgi:hypothetical protein
MTGATFGIGSRVQNSKATLTSAANWFSDMAGSIVTTRRDKVARP